MVPAGSSHRIWLDVLLEARVRPAAWNLLAVDIWVKVFLEARVRPGAWNLLAVIG